MDTMTYSQILQKVGNDLDLLDTSTGLINEEFVSATEMLGYCNEGIDKAESLIHTLYEDYFLTLSTINLVQGTSEYSLPSDIYANKIRAVIYNNGSTKYTIKRLRASTMFEDVTHIDSAEDYRYLIVNSLAGGPKLKLYPAARATEAAAATVWYIRNAKRMSTGADVCDIPEFVSFVIQYMKVRCYEKEGHPNLQFAVSVLAAEKELLEQTLSAMIPDSDNAIEQDLSFYQETV